MAPFRACIDELHACSFFLTHRSNSGLDFSTDVSKAPLRRASSFVWAVRHFPGLAAGIDDLIFLTATPRKPRLQTTKKQCGWGTCRRAPRVASPFSM